MLRRCLFGVVMAAAFSVSTPIAFAQDEGGLRVYSRYQSQLLRLAEILGTLHHLRGQCFESERQAWRDEMMELIRLEDPSSDRKEQLIRRFNETYAKARRDYPQCTRAASLEAERLAREGAVLSETAANSISN